MELHERMKAIQTDSDIMIKTLAQEFGVSEHCMGNYLNGKRTIPYDVLVSFANYFQVTTDYLLGVANSYQSSMLSVSERERTLLEQFRPLNREQKELILQMAAFMGKQNQQER